MTTREPEFEVSVPLRELQISRLIHPYAIAVDGKAVMHHRSNGQSFHMTYATEKGGRRMIGRVQAVLPGAMLERRG